MFSCISSSYNSRRIKEDLMLGSPGEMLPPEPAA